MPTDTHYEHHEARQQERNPQRRSPARIAHQLRSGDPGQEPPDDPGQPQKQAPFGTVDVINETREAGIYRLNLAAGRQAPLSVRPRAVGAAMALSDGLSCDGEQLTVGSVCRTTDGERHTYENPTPRQRTILLVHCPEPARFDWESKPRPRAHGL